MQNQLLSAVGDESYTYTYDTAGNILTANGHSYTYGNSQWRDLLTAYDGETITYDQIGNPLSYYNGTRWTFTWENGRSLATATAGTTSVSYAYDAGGLRTSKTVGDVTHTYLYASGQLLRETYSGMTFDFFYDSNGHAYALKHNGALYYYITNLQGDVMYMVDAQGNTVASYEYDPYGGIDSATGAMAQINPLRYRGYYYDAELGLYYLQSRYYDPVVGRFINADDVAAIGLDGSVASHNLYVYCKNDPVASVDPTGYWAESYSGFVWTTRGFNLSVQRCFLSRSFCVSFAKDVIKQYTKEKNMVYRSNSRYAGMSYTRIAQELWFHALVYYVGSPIKLVLGKVGINWKKLNSWVVSASFMEINNNDTRAWAFATAWYAAAIVKNALYAVLKSNPVYSYIKI